MIPIYPVVMRRGVDDIVGQGLCGDPDSNSVYLLYAGDWEPKSYKPYTVVSHNGAMWIAGSETTEAEPGTVIVDDNVGNIRAAGDFTLSDTQDKVVLLCAGAEWHEVAPAGLEPATRTSQKS